MALPLKQLHLIADTWSKLHNNDRPSN